MGFPIVVNYPSTTLGWGGDSSSERANQWAVHVRIVAATNQDLEEKIRNRAFREDLFYRLNVVTLNTPALREAPEDVPLLARHYVKIASEELGLPRRRFSAEALRLLSRFPWPGNVRQLQNLVRQAVMFSPDEEISAGEVAALLPEDDGPGTVSEGAPSLSSGNGEVTLYRDAKARVVDRFTREYIEDLLRKTDGNVTRGAELSGLGRASLQKKILSGWTFSRRIFGRSEGGVVWVRRVFFGSSPQIHKPSV